jgi:hypothetical protein
VKCIENEEFYLLGYNAVYSVENQPMIRRNMLPSSGLKTELSKVSCSLPAVTSIPVYEKLNVPDELGDVVGRILLK